jgi:hypothetical protein
MARRSDRDQDGVQHARRLSLMQKRHDLLDGREWRVMERNVPTMPRGGIFRDDTNRGTIGAAPTGYRPQPRLLASATRAFHRNAERRSLSRALEERRL